MPHAIRPAVPADVPLILALIRGLAAYEHLEHEVVADEAAIHETLFGATASAETVIAERDGEPVGFALFHHNVSTFLGKRGLYLEDLYVRPSMRGSGLGTMILKHLAALAVERECGRFEWSVLDWNENAIRFYEKAGASVLPDWRICRVTGEALQALAG